MSDEKEVKEEDNVVVVKELPVQKVAKGITEDGKKVNMLTVEDAMTEMYNDIKAIKKAVA